MPKFRDLLYSNYSAAFGASKAYDLELALRMFEGVGQIPSVLKDAPIADLGCGKGEWLVWLQRKGFTTLQGFDFSAAELAHAGGIPVECGEVTSILAAERWQGHFALLHAKDIIEHLTKQETVDFLLSCRRALRPGGLLWISTFNAQGLFSTATRYGDFTHESGFTPTSLAQVLRACGFEVESVSGAHTCPQTLVGRLRHWLWRTVAFPGRIILRARHGGTADSGIDCFTVDPDLFAIAHRSAS